jgi:hypothetical protein
MDSDQLRNFNERLSQWIASQGFWFQLRYSMSGSGIGGQAFYHLLRLVFRLFLFLVLIAIGTWIYLEKRTTYQTFIEGFKTDLKSSLSATDLEMRGFRRSQGRMEISRLAAEGSPNTFFSNFEARNVRCDMTLVDGLIGTWKTGTIAISSLNAEIRAGADDATAASQLAAAVFRRSNKVDVTHIEIADASLRWGYSQHTQGEILGSNLKIQRTDDGWRFHFKGGKFTQNWLQQLDIEELSVLCNAEGLVFEKAEFKNETATVSLTGVRIKAGERPEVTGVARVHNLNLEHILPPSLDPFVEGSVSGDFKIFGSTNSADGIGFEGQILMDGETHLALRDRIYLLKALSVVDYSRNYKRVDFREGSVQIKTQKGGIEISDVKLKSEDLFTMEGRLSVRLPTQEEIRQAVQKNAGQSISPLFLDEAEIAQAREMPKEQADITLKRAAKAAKTEDDKTAGNNENRTLFDRLSFVMDMRRLQVQEAERISQMLQYNGLFRITLPGDAFERAPRLQQRLPVDPETNRIPIMVPVEGNLYDITLQQAEEIYQWRNQ